MINHAWNDGILNYAGMKNYYTCKACGSAVESTNWPDHLTWHSDLVAVAQKTGFATIPQNMGITGAVGNAYDEDVLARLRRLEDYVMTEKQRHIDELEALRSILQGAAA